MPKKSARIDMRGATLAAVLWGERRKSFWSLENDCWGIEFVPGKHVGLTATLKRTATTARESHRWFYIVRPDRHSGKRRRMTKAQGGFLEWPTCKPADVRPLVEEWVESARAGHRPGEVTIATDIKNVTVGGAIDYYVQELTNNHARPRTVDLVRKTWERHACLRKLKSKRLWDLTRDDVKTLHKALYSEIRRKRVDRLNERAKRAESKQAKKERRSPRPIPLLSIERLPIELGGRVSDHAIQMLREAINTQRLRIDNEDERPRNVTRVMSEGKGLWHSRTLGVNQDDPRPLSDTELGRLITRLNAWDINPVHRAAVLFAMAGAFRRERAASIEWSWVRADAIVFPRHTAKGHKKTFKFPLTRQMRELLDHCRTFGGTVFVTPQRKRRGDTIEKPMNNFDWSETALRGIEDAGTRSITAHNLRDTVSTRLMDLTNGNLLASVCVLDQQSRLKQLIAVGVRYTETEARIRGWVSQWHNFLSERGLIFGALPVHPIARRIVNRAE